MAAFDQRTRMLHAAGLVEDVTLRKLQPRDYDENVHFVPNSLILTLPNTSRGLAFAFMDSGVAYRESVDRDVPDHAELGGSHAS
jgi:small-conductance mechanosensitive channel